MSPEQAQRAAELYAALKDLPESDRERALEIRESEDPLVRAELRRLLTDATATTPVPSRFSPHRTAASPGPAGPHEMVGKQVGPYQVLRVLGQGGMGIVYLAHDARLDREVALKAVLPGTHADPTLAERLRREARVLASLSHPNLATVYGLEESGGAFFIAMEYFDGRSLAQRLLTGSLPCQEALRCGEQIAAGLEAAHDEGIVHRDLKPGNVMLSGDGTCKVLDFGLARSIRDWDASTGEDHVSLTQEGSLLGTPAYMSPEQARGEPLDCRSDIFSFGAVLFRCLAGRRAFDGQTPHEVIESILTLEPDWSKLPHGLPSAVVGVLKRCLAKDLAERYRHIGDVRLDLRDARLARATDPATQPQRTIARRLAPWTVAGVAVALAAITAWPRRSNEVGSGAAQRFDVTFPGDAVQADLERVQLALAPDGRTLVVACKTPDGQALWARSQSDGQWKRIEQSEGGHRPAYSIDGQWISFFRSGHLYKHRPGGRGEPIQLAAESNWYGACWTDDGTLVYCPAWGDALQKLAPSASTPTALTRLAPDDVDGAHVAPSAVPGTRWVLYNVWPGGELTDIHAVDLDGGNAHAVVTNASTPRVAQTPRGDYLLFERGSMIFAAPFDRDRAEVTGTHVSIAEGVMNDGTRFAAYFDVAADGTLVYVPGSSFAEESRLAYVSGGDATVPFNDDRLSFCEPVFSAAAGKLAVLVKGKIYRCLLYDLKRSTREFIVTGGDTVSLAISTDGQTLACTVNRNGGYGIDLFSVADGRPLGRVVQAPAVYQSDLTWTPDSKFLAFSMPPREGAPSDIWLVEPRPGAQPRPLVATAAADTKPVTSPRGNWVAYQSDISGRAEIYLVTCPDGQTTRQVSFGGGAQPAWAPDGAKLYYIAPAGLVSVSVADAGTVTDKPVVVYDKPFGQSDPIAREYAIAPDGRPLIVEPSERRPTVSHLHVITNWYRLLP